MTDDSETILRVARDEALARDWELVLLAQGLSPRIRRTLDGIVLAVPSMRRTKRSPGSRRMKRKPRRKRNGERRRHELQICSRQRWLDYFSSDFSL